MRRLSLLGILLVLLTACSGEQDPESTSDDAPESLSSSAPVEIRPGDQWVPVTRTDGTDGRYLLHVPPSYDEGRPLPLVVAFHGAPGTAREMVRTTGFSAIADEEQFLVAYPDAFDLPEDVEVLLDDIAEQVPVDPRRVYATGFSRGASTTYLLAAEHPERFAAVGPVSGLPYDVPPTAPISLITIQGLADTLASGFDRTNRVWSRAMGCRAPEGSEATVSGKPARRVALTCRAGADRVSYQVTGMGHVWPPEATQLVWDFFDAHPRPRG
jgi:polyhydroxybutyrate depolymerase